MKRKKYFLGRTILAAALLAVFAFAASTITAYGANDFEVNTDKTPRECVYTVTDAVEETFYFGQISTTGLMTFEKDTSIIGVDAASTWNCVVKNESDQVIKVRMDGNTNDSLITTWWVRNEPVYQNVNWSNGFHGIFTGMLLQPGDSIYVYATLEVAKNPNYKAGENFAAVAAHIEPAGDVANIVTQKPKLSVTKISANKVGIKVDVNNHKAEVSGVSKIQIYKGNKVIKTYTSDAHEDYFFYHSKKGAAKAKYKVKVTSVKVPSDTKTSNVVKAKNNVWTAKVGTKPGDYEDFSTGFAVSKLSYKGSTLVVTGYIHNTIGVPQDVMVGPIITYDGGLLADASKMVTVKPGVKKYTYKIKKAKVVDLRNGGIVVNGQ